MIKLLEILQEIRITPFTQDFKDALQQKGYSLSMDFPNGLNLSGTKIKRIPRLNIKGNLNLSNTLLDSLPSGLKIYGNLNISNTLITALPPRLKIRGSLYMNNINLDTVVSNDVQVGYRVYMNNPLNAWYLNDDLRRKSKTS